MFKFLAKLFGTHKAEPDVNEVRKVDLTSVGCTPELALSLLLSRLVLQGDLRDSSGKVYYTVSSFIKSHEFSCELDSFSNESLYEYLNQNKFNDEIIKFICRARILKLKIVDNYLRNYIYE